jgi:hypothetical protein
MYRITEFFEFVSAFFDFFNVDLVESLLGSDFVGAQSYLSIL